MGFFPLIQVLFLWFGFEFCLYCYYFIFSPLNNFSFLKHIWAICLKILLLQFQCPGLVSDCSLVFVLWMHYTHLLLCKALASYYKLNIRILWCSDYANQLFLPHKICCFFFYFWKLRMSLCLVASSSSWLKFIVCCYRILFSLTISIYCPDRRFLEQQTLKWNTTSPQP